MYYHCTRSKDRDCKEKAIREVELQKQLLEVIDKVEIDEIGMREQIDAEIRKYQQFSYGVLGKETEFDKQPVEADVRNYAKHVLRNGTRDEKRELFRHLRSKVFLKDKEIWLRS